MEIKAAVRGALSRGVKTVVIGGGDGTISTAIDVFARKSDLTLGFLPLGTGNEVARVLGIPLDVAEACKVIAYGQVTKADVAEANGDFFIHTALIGQPAHVNHAIPSWLKARFGRIAYVYSLLSSIVNAKPFRVSMTVGHEHWEGETVLVVVGNGQFHVPGSILVPRTQARRRNLLVYTPKESDWATLLRLSIGLWVTRSNQAPLLFTGAGDEALVETDSPQELDLDGEFGQWTPTRFRLAREAIQVLVPSAPTQPSL
jgi:YegS/Rv2252/BmrU family lipid kinase